MVEKWVKMIFPDHGVNINVVDNDDNVLNMKFQPKLMQRSREKGQKPQFSWKIGLRHFSTLGTG